MCANIKALGRFERSLQSHLQLITITRIAVVAMVARGIATSKAAAGAISNNAAAGAISSRAVGATRAGGNSQGGVSRATIRAGDR